MKSEKFTKKIVVILTALCCLFSVLTILFSIKESYSTAITVNINVGETDAVQIYVSGDGVEKNAAGTGYTAEPGEEITITAINGERLFDSMTINGVEYTTPIATLEAPQTGTLDISVTTKDPYGEDKGQYFGNPYQIADEFDLIALARIFEGNGTTEDFARFGETNTTAGLTRLRYGYYRLVANVFISDEEFKGLGSRSFMPFQGCFDFAGYVVTIGITRTEYVDDEFYQLGSTTEKVADYGFFSYIYGDDDKPCLIKNADLHGYIAINTMESEGQAASGSTRLNLGGVAGTVGKNVVLDGIKSQVSVSVQVQSSTIYLGGVFGFCSSSINSWCNAEYDGEYNAISGITYGSGSSVFCGGFAGMIQNASVDGVSVNGKAAMMIANSHGDKTGSAIAGGFAGIIYLGESDLTEVSAPKVSSIRNIKITIDSGYTISSVISNSGADYADSIDSDMAGESIASAISGGAFGAIYRQGSLSSEKTMTFSGVGFIQSNSASASTSTEDRIKIIAQTQDSSSIGAVFSGGVVGYVYTDGVDYIKHEHTSENLMEGDVEYLFDLPVDISSIQNGIGPSYAGGFFGYNCFNLTGQGDEQARFKVTSQGAEYSVTAVQTTSSKSAKKNNVVVPYVVSAGGYTSYLQSGYAVDSAQFSVESGNIRAYREVGSTAVGDVACGGYAGIATSEASFLSNARGFGGTAAGSIENLNIKFNTETFIEASCYSFDSIDDRSTSYGGNNVYAGGVIGLLVGYNNVSNVSVEFESSASATSTKSEYFVYGVQNGASSTGTTDLKVEGYVGGVFGLTMDTPLSNISISGEAGNRSIVYFESSNNPDTASVGGLIGAGWRWKKSGYTLLDTATVENIHVAGKAYNETQAHTYDLYVGGAIGVFANPNGTGVNGTAKMQKVVVSDCTIESIGELNMLTFSGGLAGGVWWAKTATVTDCVVKDSNVTASSVSRATYASGLIGLVQGADVSSCAVIGTDVRAVSTESEATATGIFALTKTYWKIDNNVSNATLYAKGTTSYVGGVGSPIASGDGYPGSRSSEVSMTGNFFVSENANTEDVYTNTSKYNSYSGSGLHLVSYGNNSLSFSKTGSSNTVFPGLTSSTTFLKVSSSKESVAKISKSNSGNSRTYKVTAQSEGVSYVSVIATINGVEYTICSYPVTVISSGTTGDFALVLRDGENSDNTTNAVTSANSDAYTAITDENGNKYQYFRRNVGNPDTVSVLDVLPDGIEYFPSSVKVYDLSDYADTFDEDADFRLLDIVEKKASLTAVQFSVFNGRADIRFDGASGEQTRCTISTNNTLRTKTIILLEYNYNGVTHGVAVEFVPNELIGITIEPESGTPSLDSYVDDDGYTHYVYSKGDTVRFSTTLQYNYPASRYYFVETTFSGDDVKPNGTVVMADDTKVYEVTCKAIDNNISTKAYLEVRKELPFSFSLVGANVESERKYIVSSPFQFTISPQPGYNLLPSLSIKIGNDLAAGVWDGDSLQFTFADDAEIEALRSKTFTVSGEKSLTSDYTYDFTIPRDFTSATANADSVSISVEYRKTYTVVFFSNYGDNVVFKKLAPAGTKYSDLDLEGFDEWVNEMVDERYGFAFRGFYAVERAANLSTYGVSFADMQEDNTSAVNGTVRFYARWTYSVIVEKPSQVTVKSSFQENMLDDGELIPMDEYNGFGFLVEAEGGFVGRPRFDAFVRKANGTYERITDDFEKGSVANSYVVSSAAIQQHGSGIIYLFVYADSLDLSVGDGLAYDGNSFYTDGVFTVEYNVNYGANDAPSDVSFAFDFGSLSGLALPANTSLRLYYSKDGETVWSGGKVLTESVSTVSLSDFASMKNGATLDAATRTGAHSEKFTLVVTLPDNTNGFGITSALISSVNVTPYDFDETKTAYGNAAQSITDKPAQEDFVLSEEFVLYPATIHSATESGDELTYTVEDNSDTSVVDRRHVGATYLWKVEKTGGGAIGNETFASFGDELLRTTSAVFYQASAGTLGETTIDISGMTGYTISLVEVRNAQQPSLGITLYQKIN